MDLFDRLQDDLLIHIISFLPTKYAVLTSALSTRWKFLWCYANKSVVFDDGIALHGYQEDVGYCDLCVWGRVLPFDNFVDRVLKLSKASQVDKFYLKLYHSHWRSKLENVESWLDDIVTKRQAKEIQLHFSDAVCHTGIYFPFETFHSASLRVLKLYLGDYNPLSLSANGSKRLFLPNLKILHFWMDGICRKFWLFKYLFRASPQLEEAYFGGSLLRGKNLFCNIYAPSLKRLRMIFGPSTASNKFLINAPILEELVVVDDSFQRHVIKSNCHVNAKIDIGFPGVRNYQRYHILIPRVCKLLHRISHVKFLNLKAHTMDALSICCNSMHSNLPQFPALCQLKLCFLNYSSWDVIPKLLECAPNLQVLVISKDFKGSDAPFRRDSVWIHPSSIPVCLLSSLRQVQVPDCESQQVEFGLISYFHKHGDVLSSFVVDLLPAYSRDDLRFREKLVLIPRASKTCELKVSVYPHCSERSSSPDEEENRHLAKLRQLRMPPEKMCFEYLRVCTDYFSDDHLIIRTKNYKVYRGKLYQSSPFDPPVTDVVVKRWIIPAKRPYSKHKEDAMCSFREELKLLKHPNFKYHPYFMSLLGYCCEDYNERLGVVYNFKPLDCLKNLIPNDSFKWLQRIKVALVLVCISEYMHKQDGDIPSVSPRLCPSSVLLDEVPLVHKNLMEDSTYDVVDGLKITRLAMRCLKHRMYRPSMHGIIKYLCKLRVVRENWDVLGCDNIIRDHLNVLDS